MKQVGDEGWLKGRREWNIDWVEAVTKGEEWPKIEGEEWPKVGESEAKQ